jgi:hypothetical protein
MKIFLFLMIKMEGKLFYLMVRACYLERKTIFLKDFLGLKSFLIYSFAINSNLRVWDLPSKNSH